MKDYYKTLGISKDATIDEIKEAFQKKSRHQHPDRGGTDEGMAALNEAYSVLKDSTKRAEYDKTGGIKKEQTFEQKVRAEFFNLIGAALKEQGDLLQICRSFITDSIKKVKMDIYNMESQISELKVKRARIKSEYEENYFHMVIDDYISKHLDGITKATEYLKIAEEIDLQLTEYSSEEELALTYNKIYTGGTTA